MGASCTGSVINTGQACLNQYGVALKDVFQYAYSDGVLNTLLPEDLDSDVKVEALINHEDPSKRLYFLEDIENPLNERADANVETFDGGNSRTLSQGAKTVSRLYAEVSPYYDAIIKSWANVEVSVYSIDVNNNLVGIAVGDGSLRGSKIQKGSLTSKLLEPTNTTGASLQVAWNVDKKELDSTISYISGDNFELPLLDKSGLCQVSLVVSNITATGFDLQGVVDTGFKGIDNPIYLSGDLTAFWTLIDDAGTPIAITTVTENIITSNYTFVTATMTSGDHLLDLLGGGSVGRITFTQP